LIGNVVVEIRLLASAGHPYFPRLWVLPFQYDILLVDAGLGTLTMIACGGWEQPGLSHA